MMRINVHSDIQYSSQFTQKAFEYFEQFYSVSSLGTFLPSVVIKYVNPYIPTQTPEEDSSDPMQSPG